MNRFILWKCRIIVGIKERDKNIKGGARLIQLKKINKVYDDGFQALKDIDLTFEEGKINVLDWS